MRRKKKRRGVAIGQLGKVAVAFQDHCLVFWGGNWNEGERTKGWGQWPAGREPFADESAENHFSRGDDQKESAEVALHVRIRCKGGSEKRGWGGRGKGVDAENVGGAERKFP